MSSTLSPSSIMCSASVPPSLFSSSSSSSSCTFFTIITKVTCIMLTLATSSDLSHKSLEILCQPLLPFFHALPQLIELCYGYTIVNLRLTKHLPVQSVSTKQQYMWNRVKKYVESHNLTSLTNRSSYEFPAGYRDTNVWWKQKVMVRRIQDRGTNYDSLYVELGGEYYTRKAI